LDNENKVINIIKEWIRRINDYQRLEVENNSLKETLCQWERVVAKQVVKINELEKISKRIKPSVDSADYWNNKWKKSNVYYSAPKRKKVIDYVRPRSITLISSLALAIIRDYNLSHNSLDDIPLAVMKWNRKQKWKYRPDLSEKWNTPEETLECLKNKKPIDCDDVATLEYHLIREIFNQLGVWEQNSHRLKCVVGHVHHFGLLFPYAGFHFYLNWLHSSGEWMTIESTFYLARAIMNYGKKPQKYNPQYGLIAFTFNEKFSWSQQSLTVSKLDYGKTSEDDFRKEEM
jgi:hypothetical protein